MKFNEGDILYYVCPFLFFIIKIKVDMAVQEDSGLYYIDQSGAYLREENLFKNFKEAQQDALDKLEKFIHEKRYEILNNAPKFEEE